ncbi:MAG: succinate dehydrogenase assembly factor 2 [Salinisphaera sp.]|jgi:antitoxin CptB|nr:succinate dehydrogenase assembly factor 2 [Salinisphaera sp.]
MSEKSRVRWLCRRGMKELDVLLERFVASDYDALSEIQVEEMIALLQNEDPDLYYLVMGRMEAPNGIQAELLSRIRQFRPAAGI